MMPPDPAVWSRLNKPGEYTEEDVSYLREHVLEIIQMNPPTHTTALIRSNIEVISAIMRLNHSITRFDEASGKMVKRGNRINGWVLFFAVVASILGGAAAWISWLSYQLALSQAGR